MLRYDPDRGIRAGNMALDSKFIGKTRDELIVRYGPPSRTATLDNGFKLMQYNRKETTLHENGARRYQKCELRLWMQNKKVHHVDYLGDQDQCLKFADTAERDGFRDLKHLSTY